MKGKNTAQTDYFIAHKLHSFNALCIHVQQLPYGRNSSRKDFDLALQEGKGTCSSKHAFLKTIANANGLEQVDLVLGMFRMHRGTIPKLGSMLDTSPLDYIPEAHCYLKVHGLRKDYTSPQADIATIAAELLEEITIQPDQVITYKVAYHKAFIQQWIKESKIPMDFEAVWALREGCITRLSE